MYSLLELGSIFFSIVTVVGFIILWILFKKWGQKRVEEVEMQLTGLLRLILIGVVLAGIFKIAGIFVRDL